ncbi:MAG: hypothetical protein IIY21_02665 [Clostridiales bacterium]|nr:hypothetical protein [Clostridiales bacterium]
MDELHLLLQHFYAYPSKKTFARVFVRFMDMNEDEEDILAALDSEKGRILCVNDEQGNRYYATYSDPVMVPEGIRTVRISVFELNKMVFQDEDCFGIALNPEQKLPALILKSQMDTFLTRAQLRRKSLT